MNPTVLVISHRRSGTHLAIDAIVNNFERFRRQPDIAGLTLDHLNAPTPSLAMTQDELEARIARRPCVLKTHAHAGLDRFFHAPGLESDGVRRIFEASRRIYVYRDGRDVMVSLYHYHRHVDPSRAAASFGRYLRQDNDFDRAGAPAGLSRPAYWAFHVRSWQAVDPVLAVSFEDLVGRYERTLERIAAFIGAPLRRPLVRVAGFPRRTPGRFLRQWVGRWIGRRPPRTSAVCFRKGRPEDWRGHFDPADLDFFHRATDGLNPLLGYSD